MPLQGLIHPLPPMSACKGNLSYIINNVQRQITAEADFGKIKYIYQREVPKLEDWVEGKSSNGQPIMSIVNGKKITPLPFLDDKNRRYVDVFRQLSEMADSTVKRLLNAQVINSMILSTPYDFKKEFNQALKLFEQNMKKTIDENIKEMKKSAVNSDSKQANKKANLITKIKIFLLVNNVVNNNATDLFSKIRRCSPKAIQKLTSKVYELGDKMQKALKEFESKEMNEENLNSMAEILNRIATDSSKELKELSNELIPDFISLFEKWFGDSNSHLVKLKMERLKMLEGLQELILHTKKEASRK